VDEPEELVEGKSFSIEPKSERRLRVSINRAAAPGVVTQVVTFSAGSAQTDQMERQLKIVAKTLADWEMVPPVVAWAGNTSVSTIPSKEVVVQRRIRSKEPPFFDTPRFEQMPDGFQTELLETVPALEDDPGIWLAKWRFRCAFRPKGVLKDSLASGMVLVLGPGPGDMHHVPVSVNIDCGIVTIPAGELDFGVASAGATVTRRVLLDARDRAAFDVKDFECNCPALKMKTLGAASASRHWIELTWADVEVGTYDCEVRIHTNHPLTPLVRCAAKLRVSKD
jgi:hypothetical protein